MLSNRAMTIAIVVLCVALPGCASLVAEHIVKSPNNGKPKISIVGDFPTYPDGERNFLTRHVFETTAGRSIAAIELAPHPMQWSVWMADDYDTDMDLLIGFERADEPSSDQQKVSSSRPGTVVMLHGYSLAKGSMLLWASLFADAGYHSLMIDLPGHGESIARRVSFGLDDATEINKVREQLAQRDFPEPYYLLGVSLGGTVALRSMALDSSWAGGVALEPFEDIRRVLPSLQQTGPWYVRWFVGDRTLNNAIPEAERRGGFSFDDARLGAVLTALQRPALVLHSATDELVPVSEAQAIKAAAPEHIELRIFANGGQHVAFASQFWRHCEIVLNWFAEVGGGVSTHTCSQLFKAIDAKGFRWQPLILKPPLISLVR